MPVSGPGTGERCRVSLPRGLVPGTRDAYRPPWGLVPGTRAVVPDLGLGTGDFGDVPDACSGAWYWGLRGRAGCLLRGLEPALGLGTGVCSQ